MLDDNKPVGFSNYREVEIGFHRDLMNVCRRYINLLNLVSVVGTIETVKQEAIELIRATSKDSFEEKKPSENVSNDFLRD